MPLPEYTAPKTWTVNEVLPAADLNTYVRDNTIFLAETPKVAVRLTANESIPNGTDTPIPWDEAVWDTHGDMWSAGGPSAITITRDGLYSFTPEILWDNATTGRGAIFLEIDSGAGWVRRRGLQVPFGSPPLELACTWKTTMAAGHSARLVARQNSGAALNILSTGGRSLMIVTWDSRLPGATA